MAASEEPGCGAGHEGWLCTLPEGHGGQHEAYGMATGRPPYAVWPATDDGEAERLAEVFDQSAADYAAIEREET